MTVAFAVTRRIELDLPIEELRHLVSTLDGWRDWLVDDGAVPIVPGGRGWVEFDGERREVAVREAAADRLEFEWGSGTEMSTVVLRLDDTGERPVLEISETLTGREPAEASVAWDVRIALLWIRATLGNPSSVAR